MYIRKCLYTCWSKVFLDTRVYQFVTRFVLWRASNRHISICCHRVECVRFRNTFLHYSAPRALEISNLKFSTEVGASRKTKRQKKVRKLLLLMRGEYEGDKGKALKKLRRCEISDISGYFAQSSPLCHNNSVRWFQSKKRLSFRLSVGGNNVWRCGNESGQSNTRGRLIAMRRQSHASRRPYSLPSERSALRSHVGVGVGIWR